MKKLLSSKKVFILIILFVTTVLLNESNKYHFVDFLEMKSFDLRLDSINKKKRKDKSFKSQSQVVLAMADEASLETMKPLVGRWPWPRSLWGDLLDFFRDAGAKAVLFDILFTEPQIARDADGELGADDQAMIMGSINFENTYHAFQLIKEEVTDDAQAALDKPLPADFIELFAIGNEKMTDIAELKMRSNNNYYLPIAELYQNTYKVGVVEFSPDDDGIYRQTSFIRQYQGQHFPTLPGAYLLDHFKPKKIAYKNQHLMLDNFAIPLLDDKNYLINMQGQFETYSIGGIFSTIQKIAQGEVDNLLVDPGEFKDKIIFIGGSAVGIEDLKQTAIGKVPGVFLHASILDNVLKGEFIKKFSRTYSLLLQILACAIIILCVFYASNVFLQIIPLLVFCGLYIIPAYYLMEHYLIWLPLAYPLLSFFTAFMLAFIYMRFTEGADKKFLKDAFSSYISPELIDQMFASGARPKLGGDSGIITAYFTDIQGFSTFSEKLNPIELVTLLNEYLSSMTDILLKYGGTLDKYEGDAIIAFFGAPLKMDDHADKALTVAIEMQEALLTLRAKWESEGDKWPVIVQEMRMRIGVNTGEIVTGNMGSKVRMNYTMMGDSVNLAARLEEAAKQYGIFTHISEFTKDLCDEKLFEFRALDTILVVGKTQPVKTYEVLGLKGKISKNLIELKTFFEKGMDYYLQQSWDEAIIEFKHSLECEYKRFPELKGVKTNPSLVYLARCEEFKVNQPEKEWTGIYTLTKK